MYYFKNQHLTIFIYWSYRPKPTVHQDMKWEHNPLPFKSSLYNQNNNYEYNMTAYPNGSLHNNWLIYWEMSAHFSGNMKKESSLIIKVMP